jgi:hypothetical protein
MSRIGRTINRNEAESGRTLPWPSELRRVLAMIDEVNATPLVMLYQRKLTCAQVAEQLGLPEVEVSHRISIALRQLGRLLATTA